MWRTVLVSVTLILSISGLKTTGYSGATTALAQSNAQALPSHCIAMVDAPSQPERTRLAAAPFRGAMRANGPTRLLHRVATITPVALDISEVRIRYVGHSTFRIQTAADVIVATDYAGSAGDGRTPDVVTMNQAHESHYTDFPDDKIKHVLRGWNPNGGPARHNLAVRDLRIRNVPTDIRGWGEAAIKDGNSIFIFEAAGLCIGHLGHLHHKLTPEDIARIGRLDIVFVPVDGTYTMDQQSMAEVVRALKASIVIPMHYFSTYSLNEFLLKSKPEFDIEIHSGPEIVMSGRTLPDRPKMLVLPPF